MPTAGRSAGIDPSRPDRLERLREYLAAGERTFASRESSWLDPLRRLAPNAIPKGRVAATAALRPVAKRRLAKAQKQDQVRLHLGCGFTYKPGWVNIDLVPLKVDIPWDLAK